MKANKKIIGLILAGGIMIGTGFALGDAQYNDSLPVEQNLELIQTKTEERNDILELKKEQENSNKEDLISRDLNQILKDTNTDYEIEVVSHGTAIINIIWKDFEKDPTMYMETKNALKQSNLDDTINEIAVFLSQEFVNNGYGKNISLTLKDKNKSLLYGVYIGDNFTNGYKISYY